MKQDIFRGKSVASENIGDAFDENRSDCLGINFGYCKWEPRSEFLVATSDMKYVRLLTASSTSRHLGLPAQLILR